MPNHATSSPAEQSPALAQQARQRLVQFVFPLLVTLNQHLDVRLVRTFLATLEAIVQWRNRAHGLLLSELGAYLASPEHAPAGTKRLSNLLRSPNWAASLIAQFLWSNACAQVARLSASGEEPLAVWDESVLEKPESITSEGLCAVRSSKARRLKRVRPGFFNPPGGRPICVAGLHWLGLLITSRRTAPVVAAMEWWTSRGERATTHKRVLHELLARTKQAWGRQVRHVFDRGFASGPWLHTLLEGELRFVLRWKKRQKLLDGWGEVRKAWQIAQGKRSWEYRALRDPRTGQARKVGIVALPVNHPEHAQPLWLVVARPGKGQEPWYLLTSDVVRTAEQAWEVALAYARRWQIETTWRYSKSELAMESPRLWSWERRVKLLLMVTLVYGFLLSLLDEELEELRAALLRAGCHRTGKRSREVAAPLYRLRSALSRLWQDDRASPRTHRLSSG
jgi:hypothetical protein